MKAGKVAIALRIGTAPDPAFFMSWTRLMRDGLRPGDVILHPAIGMPHSCACNFLASAFLSTDCDSVLFIDDDMVFGVEALNTLRDSDTHHDILAALYTTRRPPVRPIVLDRDGDKIRPRALNQCVGILDCDVVGLGFTLFSRRVIEHAAAARGGDGVFTWDNQLGEDGHFCLAAVDAGFKVGVDCSAIVGHRVTYTSRWSASEQAVEMGFESVSV
jgi:hypothetical protein